ncbi:MAG: hypothetical protein NC548_22860 [Lachnospiraceae bacterium]|nr:hypothetical protein [Lachnospiraceae bacterium]
MAKYTKEEAIARIKAGLHCGDDEAEDVYNYDLKIDHDEKTEFDLNEEQEKVAKSFLKTGTRKTPAVYQFQTRERKPNATKGGIIQELVAFFAEKSNFEVKNIEIVNKERQISFEIGEEKFDLTLIQKRKPKNK